MKILRTDGGGECLQNVRLKIVRKMLFQMDVTGVYMLHDHKGMLTVIWEKEPTFYQKDIVNNAWYFFDEDKIEHKLITTKDVKLC
tara:strand:- start:2219 stop:2473 length:255 start_codon:yes stop_codon:yes gene_type:complete